MPAQERGAAVPVEVDARAAAQQAPAEQLAGPRRFEIELLQVGLAALVELAIAQLVEPMLAARRLSLKKLLAKLEALLSV